VGRVFFGVAGLDRMTIGCVSFAVAFAVAFAVLQMKSARFLEFVLLTTRQREADQPYRKENLTQKFHGLPLNRGTASLQHPSSRI